MAVHTSADPKATVGSQAATRIATGYDVIGYVASLGGRA